MRLPKALLIDLDDTLICYDGVSAQSWVEACAGFASDGISAETLIEAITGYSNWYFSDPERHRLGRNDLEETRRSIVRSAMRNLGIPDDRLADEIGDRFKAIRYEKLFIFPGTHQTLDELRRRGFSLCMVTNGDSHLQRKKIERFSLERHFDGVLIEGELGFGKPDRRVFERALDIVGADAEETWVIGDNLEWEIVAPAKLGFTCVWVDKKRKGLPAGSSAQPDAIIEIFSEVLDLLDSAEPE
jgi:putative hydrolase of the HAD superfamily